MGLIKNEGKKLIEAIKYGNFKKAKSILEIK